MHPFIHLLCPEGLLSHALQLCLQFFQIQGFDIFFVSIFRSLTSYLSRFSAQSCIIESVGLIRSRQKLSLFFQYKREILCDPDCHLLIFPAVDRAGTVEQYTVRLHILPSGCHDLPLQFCDGLQAFRCGMIFDISLFPITPRPEQGTSISTTSAYFSFSGSCTVASYT